MKLLWVATKPPWPPKDGGRLALALTVDALRAAGHEITVLAPQRPRSLSVTLSQALAFGVPASIARHTHPALRRSVEATLRRERFDVVIAEQLQALPQCEPAFARGVPVVLRAQNVETDLWRQQSRGRWAGLPGLEERRLARYEASAARRVALTLALTAEDAARLTSVAAGVRVESVAAPFPAELPAGPDPLPGAPALVVLAGAGWRPNLDGARWFLDSVWPLLRRNVPGAHLHVFGALHRAADTTVHASPPDSAAAFARGSIHVVPLLVASGVRMKVLEAWARGVPVIATTAAAAGLQARPEAELCLADNAPTFASAVARVHGEAGVRERLVAGGREALRARHDPQTIAARWTELLEQAAGQR